MEPETPETPTSKESVFENQVGAVVRAILAVGGFAVIAAAVAMGTAASIPDYFIGIVGIAIGIFVGGNPFKK